MRVLQLTAYYPPGMGGIQYYVQSLSAALARRGHAVDVLTINTDASAPVETGPHGVSVARCRLDFSLYRALVSREFTRRLMYARSYDVYHIHVPFHVGLETAVSAARLNRIPLVATHHGQGVSGSPLYTLLASAYSWLSRALTLRGVDRTIFLTQSYARALWLPDDVRRRTRIVRTGAEIDHFSPDASGDPVRRQYGLDRHAPIILFVGSLKTGNRYKGVDYLIRAFAHVRSAIPNARLMIVGGGELVAGLQTLAHSLNLADAVIFAGSIDNARLPGYYAAADVLALPSIRGPENSPVVVFEAMASGKPVVASNLPGVCEIVEHERSGLLVPPRDVEQLGRALTRVLADRDFRVGAGRGARARAESYSWDHCAQAVEAVFEDVLAKPSRRRRPIGERGLSPALRASPVPVTHPRHAERGGSSSTWRSP